MTVASATIADVTTLVTKGTTPTTLGRQFKTHGIGFIKAECISGDGALIAEKQVYIDEETDQLLKRSRLQKDDVLFSIAGVIGRTALVQQSVLPANTNQAIAILRPDPAKIVPRFLYYTVRAQDFQHHSFGHVVQTAQANVSLGVLSAVPIWLPPFSIQRRIAGILSAYDDLIENCQRRIKILEAMARNLYREWFVHFRFPGHQAHPTLDGLPSTWRACSLDEVAEIKLGKMLDKAKNRGQPMPYLANLNVQWGKFVLDDLRTMLFEDDELERYGLKDGDIVMCEGGEPGRCALWKNQIPGMMFQKAIHRIRCREGMSAFYLYQSLRLLGEAGALSGLFTGSTIKHLPLEKLAKVQVVTPPPMLLALFDRMVEPIEAGILVLQGQVENLRRTRDLLLPQLLSGKLAIDDFNSRGTLL